MGLPGGTVEELRANMSRLEAKTDRLVESIGALTSELKGILVQLQEWNKDADRLQARLDENTARLIEIEKKAIGTGLQLRLLWTSFIGTVALAGKTLFAWLAEMWK